MADHKPGTMNIRVQEKTFENFVRFSTRSVIVILALLVVLALVGA